MPTPEQPQAILFDFDGTIADTRELIITSYRQAFEQVGFACPSDQRIGATIGIPLASAFRVLTAGDEVFIQQAVAAYQDIYRRQGYGMVQAFPGMIELIRTLAAGGTPLAIASSRSRQSLLGMAAHLGIADCFAAILSRDDVSKEKPHPEMVHSAAARLSADPEQMVMIGDTSFDIAMGVSAGATAIAVTWGNHERTVLEHAGAHCIVDTVAELGGCLTDYPSHGSANRACHSSQPSKTRSLK